MLITRLVPVLFALVAMVMPALAKPVSITGSVIYRERLALPAGANLHVVLVRLPDGQRVVGAGAVIAARATPPLDFTFTIRSDLDSAGSYGLVAEIRAGGTTLFRNGLPEPIALADPAPVTILVQRQPQQPVVVPAVPAPDPALLDSVWQVTSIGGRPVPAERPPTLSIAADLRAGGHGGCNSYFTQAAFEDGSLTFGPAAATQMACAPELMALETSFFVALAAVRHYEREGDGLRLLDAAGVPLVGLIRTADE